jgi:hypothetical protein
MTKYQYNDGGRREAGYKGDAEDCVVRAIAIVTEKPYREVYDAIKRLHKKVGASSPRYGSEQWIYDAYIKKLGLVWTPTIFIKGKRVMHLKAEELPQGRIICRVLGHMTAVIDGVIHDTYNPAEYDMEEVYGYYSFCSPAQTQ